MRILLLSVLICVNLNLQAQCEFLLDSLSSLNLTIPSSGHLQHVKYQYDAERRIKVVRDDQSVNEYFYEKNKLTQIVYNSDKTEVVSRIIRFSDDHDRLLRTEFFHNESFFRYDSLQYSADGKILTLYQFTYSSEEEVFYLNLVKYNEFDQNNNLLISNAQYYSQDGHNNDYHNISNTYDEQSRVRMHTESNTMVYGGERHDTIFMEYHEGQLSKQIRRIYYLDKFNYATKNDYFYTEDSLITYNYRKYETLENDFMLTSIRRSKLTDHCIGEELSGEVQIVSPNGEMRLHSIWKNEYDSSQSKDTVFVRRDLRQVDANGNLVAVLVENEIWTRPTGLEVNEYSATKIKIYPNPSLPNSPIFINSHHLIDGYMIFDSRGKIIQNKLADRTVITSLTSPQISGTYYILFMYQGKAVGNTTRLIVL